MLKDPAPGDGEALAAFLTRLADAGRNLDRATLKELLGGGNAPGLEALTAAQRAIADEALRDLDLSLIEIPDASLGADFAYLATAIRDDLATPATEALARMESLRKRLLRAGGARMFLATTDDLRRALAPRIEAFAARLDTGDFIPVAHGTDPLVDKRVRMRDPGAAPLHVGLYAPNKQGGVIITSVPTVHFSDAGDKEKQLDYLSSRLFGGAGSHGLFSKTVAAGLAYSNGLRGSVSQARAGYYAERTPELPQTVRFAAGIVKDGKLDRALGEYVMAQAFTESRAANTYEVRAEGIAADLADGQPPEQVRRFRRAILDLRRDPKLVDKLYERKDRVYASMLPGYSAKAEAPDGVYFVIGPDKQLDAWEQYLKATEGAGTKLYRLYGRDFWMP
jgi:hypothetical protein